MAKKQVKTSDVLAKLKKTGARKAWDKSKGTEVRMSAGGDLPPGVMGVARLSSVKLGEYEKGDMKGKPYFMAVGIVIEPAEFKGMRTTVGPIPLCDTPGRAKATQAEHIDDMMNELKKFGSVSEDSSIDDLDEIFNGLMEEKPAFKFRTWASAPNKQYPNPRTNHDWRGTEGCEDYADSEMDATAGVEEDETVEAEEEEAPEEEEVEEEAEEQEEEQEEEAEEEAEEEEAEGPPHEKGDVVKYKPPGSAKSVECEVTLVKAKAGTSSLKNLDNGKAYKDVKWKDIRPA